MSVVLNCAVSLGQILKVLLCKQFVLAHDRFPLKKIVGRVSYNGFNVPCSVVFHCRGIFPTVSVNRLGNHSFPYALVAFLIADCELLRVGIACILRTSGSVHSTLAKNLSFHPVRHEHQLAIRLQFCRYSNSYFGVTQSRTLDWANEQNKRTNAASYK